MTCRSIKTQAEFDAARSDSSVTCIHVESERGVWIGVAFGSATVRAFDSATVEASGSATVEAFDSATVEAFDSATVRAFDSATVRASGSATVRAFGSATVEAFDSATVEAFGSATVRASKYVAVHLHSARVTVSGGVVIDVSNLDLADLETWAEYVGAERDGDGFILYKAVTGDLRSERGFAYPIGETVEVETWTANNECGGGLHLSPTPSQARSYFYGATRYLRCRVAAEDLRPIPGGVAKAKARRVQVISEVDVFGREVTA